MPNKLIIVLEDKGMDDGCTFAIFQECVEHATILEARLEGTDINTGEPWVQDLMHEVEHITPKGGKC